MGLFRQETAPLTSAFLCRIMAIPSKPPISLVDDWFVVLMTNHETRQRNCFPLLV